MKSVLTTRDAMLALAMMREFPTAFEVEFAEPELLPPVTYQEASEYPRDGKVRNGGKRKWKGRDKVKAARKQRRSQK